MARALWKGHLKIAELSCPVALHAAASTSDRIAFHVLNRKTGNRIRRQYVDEETGKSVEREDQIKGYETDKDQYVGFEPDEIADLVPRSDKTIRVEAFVRCPEVRTAFFDRPYYLTPDGSVAAKTYTLICKGMQDTSTAAIGRAILFRKVRMVLIRPFAGGLGASTLSFDHEVRSAAEVFAAIPDLKIKRDMLDLAGYIIETKEGSFDPAQFEDRYEAALRELVEAKAEGRTLDRPVRMKEEKVVDLMAALRASASAAGKPATRKRDGKGEADKGKASGRKAG